MDKPLTYDEALSKHIGQFGPGQWLQVFWASIPQIANAAAFFLWTFITINPVADHSWRCSSPADAACAAMWQQEVPSSSSFCSLSPDQWQWSSQGEHSLSAWRCCSRLPLMAGSCADMGMLLLLPCLQTLSWPGSTWCVETHGRSSLPTL
jgi:hypothetical protein